MPIEHDKTAQLAFDAQQKYLLKAREVNNRVMLLGALNLAAYCLASDQNAAKLFVEVSDQVTDMWYFLHVEDANGNVLLDSDQVIQLTSDQPFCGIGDAVSDMTAGQTRYHLTEEIDPLAPLSPWSYVGDRDDQLVLDIPAAMVLADTLLR